MHKAVLVCNHTLILTILLLSYTPYTHIHAHYTYTLINTPVYTLLSLYTLLYTLSYTYRPTLILGLLWQIIKLQLLCKVTVTDNPEMDQLRNENETEEAFAKLPPEQILLRYI